MHNRRLVILGLGACVLSSPAIAQRAYYLTTPLQPSGLSTKLAFTVIPAISVIVGNERNISLKPFLVGNGANNASFSTTAPYSIDGGILSGSFQEEGTFQIPITASNGKEVAETTITIVAYVPRHAITHRLASSTNNFNLSTLLLSLGWSGDTSLDLELIIPEGIVIGASNTATPALDFNITFPPDSRLKLVNHGTIVGAGGAGGQSMGYNSTPQAGAPGGPAIRTNHPLSIENLGLIGGGGGGGGASNQYAPTGSFGIGAGGAGGGAGALAGSAGNGTSTTAGGSYGQDGSPGSLYTGGTAGSPGIYNGIHGLTGGRGGDLGHPGANGQYGGNFDGVNRGVGVGGAAGAAVLGGSYVTWLAKGDVRGSH